MGKQTNTIEINGQRYNASTGEAITSVPKPKSGRRTANVDGVVASRSHASKVKLQQAALTPKPVVKVASITKKPVMDIARHPATRVDHHKPQPGKTLMRRAVQKPQPSLKRRVKALQPLDAVQPRVFPSVTGHPLPSSIKSKSLAVKHSPLIRHFNPVTPSAPLLNQYSQFVQKPARGQSPSSSPLIAKAGGNNLRPDATNQLIQRALQNATSHTEQPIELHRSHLSKTARIVTGTLIAFALIGIAGYQNVGNIKLRLASRNAGFAATLPAYRPAGYSLTHVTSAAGAIGINFHSNSDQRTYSVTEKTSDWDSTALVNNFITPTVGKDYQTVEAAGRSIYLYGKSSATWVNGGVWYQAEGNGSLSNQQLIDLASSI